MRQALKQAQDQVQRLHQVAGMTQRLELVAECLDQARQHRQQAALLLVVVQQPARVYCIINAAAVLISNMCGLSAAWLSPASSGQAGRANAEPQHR